MNKALHNIVRGIGSVLNVAPRNDYSHLIPNYSTKDALAMDFARTGDDLRASMSKYEQETTQPSKTKG